MHVRLTLCAVLTTGMLVGPGAPAGADPLHGTVKDDRITGTPRGDYIDARRGDDTVWAKGGADEVDAGTGDDTVHLGPGQRVASFPGQNEYDLADGGGGNDVLNGNGGTDGLLGGKGDDVLRGGAGDDFLSGSEGYDLLVGGAGRDQFRLDIPEDDNAPLAITKVRGGADDDAVYAVDDDRADEIDCGTGNDVVHYFNDRDPDDILVGCEKVKEGTKGWRGFAGP